MNECDQIHPPEAEFVSDCAVFKLPVLKELSLMFPQNCDSLWTRLLVFPPKRDLSGDCQRMLSFDLDCRI
jgi:hypothetical protein